eukprot:1175653-Prorocentrum_minimum.AAC.2
MFIITTDTCGTLLGSLVSASFSWHAGGRLAGDLTPSNLAQTPANGRWRVVSAHASANMGAPCGVRGVSGYMAPEFVYRDATTHFYRTKTMQLNGALQSVDRLCSTVIYCTLL